MTSKKSKNEDIKKVYDAVARSFESEQNIPPHKRTLDMLDAAIDLLKGCRRNFPFTGVTGYDYYLSLYNYLTRDRSPYCRHVMRGRCSSVCPVYSVCWYSLGPATSSSVASTVTPYVLVTRLSMMAAALRRAQIEKERADIRKALGNYQNRLNAIRSEDTATHTGRVSKPKHKLIANQLAGMSSPYTVLRCFSQGHSLDERYLLERTYSALYALYTYFSALALLPLEESSMMEVPMYELPLCVKYRADGAVPCEGCPLSMTSFSPDDVLVSGCIEPVWTALSGSQEPAVRRDLLETLLLVIKDLVNG